MNDVELRKVRAKYIKGDYETNESFNVEKELSMHLTSRSVPTSSRLSPSSDTILSAPKGDISEQFHTLYVNATSQSNRFDPNYYLDQFLDTIHMKMQNYRDPPPYPERIEFPFLICVVGTQCSGKTTIVQYVSKFFDVEIVNVNQPENEHGIHITNPDEKSLLPLIIQELKKLPPQKGCIIVGYPLSKNQFSSFEKAITPPSKVKGEQPPQLPLSSLSAIIRTAIPLEQIEEYNTHRLIHSDSGEIFHSTFNPPTVLDDISLMKPYPGPEGLSVSAQKLNNNIVNLESVAKKTVNLLNIEISDNVNNIYLQVENLFRQLYENAEIPVPFTSFVEFREAKALEYSKKCSDIYDFWFDSCLSTFAENMILIYNQIDEIHKRVAFLNTTASEKYAIILYHKDDRNLIKLENSNACFNFYWNSSMAIKKDNLFQIEDVLLDSGIPIVSFAINKLEFAIFQSIIKRIFISKWFINQFSAFVEDTTFQTELSPLTPPSLEFDIYDQNSISEFLGLEIVDSKIPFNVQTFFSYFNVEDETVKTELAIFHQVYQVLENIRKNSIKKVDLEFDILRKKFRKWAHTKFSFEMEEFSKVFRHFNETSEALKIEPMNPSLFGDEDVADIINRVNPYLNKRGTVYSLPFDSLKSLLEKLKNQETTTLTLEELIEIANNAQLPKEECATIEIQSRLKTLPDSIDALSLIFSLCPDQSKRKDLFDFFFT